MTEEHDQDNLEHDPAVAEPSVDTEANPAVGEIDADADGVIDDPDPHPIANDPAVAKAESAEERRERRAKDEERKPAPKPKADAGLKPQRSATKAGKSKSSNKSTYNPGKTPPKPIELKDHSPWYIPWIGTGLIVVCLILLVLNYVLRGLPPLNNWWIPICFGGMTGGLIVLSRWK